MIVQVLLTMNNEEYPFIDKKIDEILRAGEISQEKIRKVILTLRSPYDGIEFLAKFCKKIGKEIDPELKEFIYDSTLNLNSKARENAGLDYLTRVINRERFIERAAADLQSAIRYKELLSIIMYDIDDFKSINDRYGHQVGDDVLVEIANLINNMCRAGDCLGRYGGEEFIMAMPKSSKESTQRVAERIRKEVEHTHIANINEIITITGGISTYEEDGNELIWLIRKADSALYHGKETGRNRIIPYTPGIPLKINGA